MSDKQVEHHWHDPSQGQVTKAMLQHFNDLGINREEVLRVLNEKIDDVVYKCVSNLLSTEQFTKLLLDAVAHFMISDRRPYEQNKYGYHNKLRDMVNEKIKEIVMADYEVTVKPRTKKE